jgi:WD40 repeat protein
MALGFVAFTADQRGVVAGLAERGEGERIVETLKWWQLPELREQGVYQNPRGQRTRGAFARAGDTILMLSAEKLDERRFSPVLTRWNLASGERKRLPLPQTAPTFMAMAVSDKLAATVGGDKDGLKAALWNAETGTAIGSLEGGEEGFAAVAIAPDSRTIATAGWGTHLDLWDAATRKIIKNIEIDGRDGVGQLIFAPDGKSVAALDHHGTWRLWDLDKNRITVKCDDHLGTGSTLQFAPDGKVLAAGDADGRLEIWSVATGKPTGEAWRLPGPIHGLAFSDDGRHLATINGNGTVYILRRSR